MMKKHTVASRPRSVRKQMRGSDMSDPRAAGGGLSAAVKQLEGKEQTNRASARLYGFLPVITVNADAGDPAWDTPAFMICRRSGCVSGSSGSHGRSVRNINRSTYRSSFHRAAIHSGPGKEDKEACQ